MQTINILHHKTHLPLGCMLMTLGVAPSTYYSWYGRRDDFQPHPPKSHWLLPEERQAIITYAKAHRFESHRRLTYQMLDQDIVAVSPSSVYRVLKAEGLLNRWNQTPLPATKKGFDQPAHPHEHWHIDIKYVRVDVAFYFLISVMDGYSRYILHFELRPSMTTRDVEITLERTRERYPNIQPRLISDNGPQFIAKDFHEYLKWVGLQQVRTGIAHPQSNGKLERYHRTLEEECIRQKPLLDLEDARQQIQRYVDYYNTRRLHSALFYLTPDDFLNGRVEQRVWERETKLQLAKEQRKKRMLTYSFNQNSIFR